MNFLDRAISALSPERALRRSRARAALRLMNYDGASAGRRASSLRAPASSADAAGFTSRARLRNVARDLIRNRPWAGRAQMVIAGNVCGGAGIQPSIRSDDPATRDAVAALVRQHLLTPAVDSLGESSLPALQRLVMNAVFCDGEVLVRRRYRRGRFASDLPLPFQVEMLEADHLNTGLGRYGENEVIEGVEIGPTGRIEAYHLYRQHPGEVRRYSDLTTERVAARDVLHIRRIDRPGQLRGVSWLAPVVLTLADLSDYQEAELVKQKMASLMAAFHKREAGERAGAGGIEGLEPGAIIEIDADDDVVFTQPPRLDGFEAFTKAQLRAVAAPLGITYEALSGDLEGVNYSSGRMGRMEMDRNIETWQKQILIDQFCAGIARWVDEAISVVTPSAPLRGYSWVWTPPRRPLIDPPKEIPAAIKEVDAGLTSLERKQRELGLDPDVIQEERRRDAERAAQLTDITGESE